MTETPFVKKIIDFSKTIQSDFIKKIVVFDSLDSTNNTAKELAIAGADEGTVIIARTQKHGRGRFDRVWESPEGGIYLSLILRPKISLEKISLLSFIAGLAVIETMDSFNLHPMMKWPNDVHVNGKKIAGILLESEMEGQSIHFVVVGVGMNLNINISDLSANIQSQSTSLSHEIGSSVEYFDFFRMFLMNFEQNYSLFLHNQFDRIIDEWKKHSDTLGKPVHVHTSTGHVHGVAVDVDPSGFLLLRTEKGELKKMYSGDCVYLKS